ncbi:MAG: hypothetical protein RID81_18510 [Sandaracinaceae bacterium]
MEASLTSRHNLYAETRLGSYGLADRGWDALPEWNPRTERVTRASAARFVQTGRAPLSEDATPIWSGEAPGSWEAWRALGERVFFELPLRHEPFWETALRDPELAARLGVIVDDDGTMPGLVWMRDVDGRAKIGITCALCHVDRAADGGPVIAGRARRALDYGRVRIAHYEARGRALAPDTRARWESWGPGRADVIEDVADTPIAIPDLYGLRHERLLTQAGTLSHASPLALLVRQETQYIQANHHQARPPRELVFALAVYLYALEPPRPSGAAHSSAGARVFERECARCHDNEVGAGDALVPAARVGTDPELAMGHARGTGGYRPSPLVRVADAAPYLHDGSVPSLEDLFGRARFDEGYTAGRRPGPVRGHSYGTTLDDAERRALLTHLASR